MKSLSMLKEEKEQQFQFNKQENNRIWEQKKVGSGMFAHLENRFKKPTTKANSERASLLEPIVKRIQDGAKGTQYAPMTKARICAYMSYIPTEDLDFFHKLLSDSPCYGAIWNWYVRPKDFEGMNLEQAWVKHRELQKEQRDKFNKN